MNNCPHEAVYWLWLQRKLGVSSRVMPSVLSLEGGARRLHESTPDELWQMGLFSVKTINSLNDRCLDMDEETLKRCEESEISITFPGDINYPRQLLNLPDPPAVLFYRGDLYNMAKRPCIALVGTRGASKYGMAAAEELACRLSRAGVTVVSGCARGIDTAAHTGALQPGGGCTVAVLGCGIDFRYNMQNELLRERISSSGALVSEYPPGTDAKAHHFPIRNRIISGLSLGTVVIEADSRSGSLITARLALEQGRDVFAMPTTVGTTKSSGIQMLYEEGAYMIRSPLDILKHYTAMYPGVLNLTGTERVLMAGREPEQLPKVIIEEKKQTPAQKALENIFEPETVELPDFISEGAKNMYQYLRAAPQLADNLARQASVPAADAMMQLGELELCGYAKAHPGGRYSLP